MFGRVADEWHEHAFELPFHEVGHGGQLSLSTAQLNLVWCRVHHLSDRHQMFGILTLALLHHHVRDLLGDWIDDHEVAITGITLVVIDVNPDFCRANCGESGPEPVLNRRVERNGNIGVTEHEHLDIIRRKTADLFAACTQIGAILGGAGEECERALASYGLKLGLCFQMVDDLLDFTAEEKTLGKPVANDLREGKVTLPMIFLIRRGGKAAAEKVKAVLDDRAFARVTRDELVRMARDCGALEDARRMAERYAEEARRELLAFEPSEYREALEALPGFILARDH